MRADGEIGKKFLLAKSSVYKISELSRRTRGACTNRIMDLAWNNKDHMITRSLTTE